MSQLTRRFFNDLNYLIKQNVRLLTTIRASSRVLNHNHQFRKSYNSLLIDNNLLLKPSQCSLVILREKSKHGKKQSSKEQEEEESDDEEENFDEEVEIGGKGVELKTLNLTSLRIDLILKAGLGYNRNKIEKSFYQVRIRRNGRIATKKAENVSEGDEIDVVKGISTENPAFLNIGRVEVLNIKFSNESVTVKLRCYKNLVIENYTGSDEWRQ